MSDRRLFTRLHADRCGGGAPKEDSMALTGKRIVITGAAGGLGRATATALQKAGARVVGIDKKRTTIGDDLPSIVADVRDPQAVSDAIAEAVSGLGGLDILINNAGILSLQDAGAAPGDEVLEALEVNLLGPWRVTAAALPALQQSRGHVINIASLFAVVNAPFIPAYAASKRALTAYSDSLRQQYGDRITVSTIYPGYMDTPIHDGAVRQGLSVARIVTFAVGGRTLLTFEESLDAAAARIVRACESGRVRDGGMTIRGWLTLMLARHAPGLTDRVVAFRLGQLGRRGMSVRLDVAGQSARQ
jgi:NAD(P)-dependent dehydrogenase (short-subunit alcohol dehydrogenase family)